MPTQLSIARRWLAASLALSVMAGSAALAQQASPPAAPPMADCTQTADRAKAITACSDIIKSRGTENSALLSAYRARAAANLANKKTADALSDLTRALVLDPKNPALWIERGDVRANLGQRIRSAADYSVALKYDPKNAKALVGRGEQFRALGALQRAIADHTEALKVDPKSAAAYAGRAYAQVRLGNDKDAAADAEEAIKLDARSSQAYIARALSAAKSDKVKATNDLKKALELDPASVIAKAELDKLSR
jgi:tetratricopeptide (TPR) repeat protein